MRILRPSRRQLITGAASVGGLVLAGCDRLPYAPQFKTFLDGGETLSLRSQRLLLSGQPLAREFSARDMSPVFKVNGSDMPADPAYAALAAKGFADWRLQVAGMVQRPGAFSLAQLRALPSRRRSPVTTASKAGARSANGPERPSACS